MLCEYKTQYVPLCLLKMNCLNLIEQIHIIKVKRL